MYVKIKNNVYLFWFDFILTGEASAANELRWLEKEEKEIQAIDKRSLSPSDTIKKESDKVAEKKIDKTETAFLVAARNGIVEMVNEILNRIPSVIHNTNSHKENVLLVAVMNRQPFVVENLKMKMQSKPEVWNNLALTVDENENTILHWAAYAPGGDKSPQIAGSALQMMWDIKWFQVYTNKCYFELSTHQDCCFNVLYIDY